MLTIGVRARRALCRLASPLPRPGPRCNKVAAGRPVMRPYPSAAPVATPSKSARTGRISGTSSRAATKCISEVPGFVKQVSTPFATSVRSSACAPFMFGLLGSVEQRSGVEDAVRIEGGLDSTHQRNLVRVLELEKVLLLLLADAVLGRDRAAHLHAGRDDRVHDPVTHLVVGLEHRQMDVAVARVSGRADQRRVLRGDRRDGPQILGYRG